jgi:hypothetical protein
MVDVPLVQSGCKERMQEDNTSTRDMIKAARAGIAVGRGGPV